VHIYNNSVCKGADGYYIALEIHGREEWVGQGYTCIFAKSAYLMNWELLDPISHSYDRSRYTACPVLRYTDGFYYIICLESLPMKRYVPYIARTKDFEIFEMGHYNPVMWFDDDDKLVQHPGQFAEEQLDYIANSVNSNVSDLDVCDYNGKTVILYSWGNQLGKEFLAEAEYDGSMAEFLKSFFVDA
jgi:alpha-L-fucosidase